MRRGHDVLVLGSQSMAGRAAEARVPFASYSSVPPRPAGVRLEESWDLTYRMTHGIETEVDVFNTACSYQPDVLVIDCMMSAPFRAAWRLGRPAAALCGVLYRPFVEEWGNNAIQTDVKLLLGRVEQVLVVVPPGLDSPGELPPGTEYVGPICHPDEPDSRQLAEWDLEELATSDDPWVLLSLSTTPMDQARALGPILAALVAMPVRVLLTLGGVIGADTVPLARNVVVRGFVPHDLALPHVDLVISHGGLSSISATLVAGKPLVCIPQGRDQYLNAERVEVCGAGLTLRAESTPAEIAFAINTVLNEPSFRRAAEDFATTSRPLGRGAVAVDRIEGLLALT